MTQSDTVATSSIPGYDYGSSKTKAVILHVTLWSRAYLSDGLW
jgi:hypothetical protein